MNPFTTEFSIDELATLARMPDVEATRVHPDAESWADRAWVRIGSGPRAWWVRCATCDRLYVHWSNARRAVYYRHGGRMIRTRLGGFWESDASALARWITSSCGGPALYVPEVAPSGGLVLGRR